jgi:predicted negative regulator of RcsB-dependent stress response
MKKKEKRSNSIRKQACFSWKTNGIQSLIGWLLFLSFSIGWTVFIPGPKKSKLLVGLFSFLVQKKENNSIRKQTWFSWRTNIIQSFIGWLLFLSFSIGWTVFIPGPKKRKQFRKNPFVFLFFFFLFTLALFL